ncbi:MAG: glycosyltransferase family 1 protein, partial [Candidatus Omnitrophica bacterium]|nr:glycosyltransferase family 1 protein [Candidatus Omnitrophota bacterium]
AKDNIDIFWATQNMASPFFSKRIKTVITMHDLVWYLMPKFLWLKNWPLLRLLGLISIKKASCVICDSNATKSELQQLPVKARDIKVIYSGLDKDFTRIDDAAARDIIEKKYGLKGKFILCVSTLEPRKNHVRLIKAYEKIFDNIKEYKLVIVGCKGWRYKEIFETQSQLSQEIKKQVVFLDYIQKHDLIALYSISDLLVFPSLREGFGLPIVEAMACGCPVATSNLSSMPEVAGDAAVLFNPYDIDNISKAIYSVLSNAGLKEELVNKGYENIKRFSWEEAALEILSVFENINKE